jgi:trk/ktr system potassium uptake protein
MKSPSLQFTLFINGVLLMMLAGAMIAPAAIDLDDGNPDWQVFAGAMGITFFTGVMLILANYGVRPIFTSRSRYLLTVLSWLFVSFFGCLPFALGPLDLNFTGAFFESMSGLTTTGSTVLLGLDNLAPGLLLWRSMLQWFGGIGIVVMAIVLLPAMRVGGMQLFRIESSDISGKVVPHFYELAMLTAFVYVGLSVMCAIAYRGGGLGWFDAINHAMTTLSTGGYSTKDASLGFYDSPVIEAVSIVFMTFGALPLIFYARLLKDGWRTFDRERQVFAFIVILAVGIASVTIWNHLSNHMGWSTALRESAVNVTSILTNTGYATTDFSTWGSFAVGSFFLFYFVGGCAGSTAGSIKVFRWQLLLREAHRQLLLMYSPNRVSILRYGGQSIDNDMLGSVRNFFFLYLLTFMVLSLACMATGMDFLSSTSAVAQGMANTGPGLGPVVGPATTFAAIPDLAKWIIIVAMLVGRLELTSVYVLLLRDFWRS